MSVMSYASAPAAQPLIGETIGQALERTARRLPDRPALVVRSQDVRLSWSGLLDAVDAFAAGLLALGLAPGDRVGIWSPNNAEWVIAQLATARAGMILVTINPAYRLHELEYALTKVGCRALVSATAFKTATTRRCCAALLPELAHCAAGPAGAARVPSLRNRDPDRRAQHPRQLRLRRGRGRRRRRGAAAAGGARRARCSSTTRSTSSSPRAPPARRRARRSPTTTSSTTASSPPRACG